MKNAVALIVSFFVLLTAVVTVCTLQGEGLSFDAVIYRNKAYKLITALEEENFEQAAEYLSFYGSEDIENARKQWISDMELLNVEIFSANSKALSADDGITKTSVEAYFPNGHELCFDIIVQGKGLAIGSVRITGDGQLSELYSKAMTSYNPG